MKYKARFIYHVEKLSFFTDIEVDYNIEHPRLSSYKILRYQENIHPRLLLREIRKDPFLFTRYCVDYNIGIEVSKYHFYGNCKPINITIKPEIYNIAQQQDFLDKIFSKFTFARKPTKQKLLDKVTGQEYSKSRSYIKAILRFCIFFTSYIYKGIKQKR